MSDKQENQVINTIKSRRSIRKYQPQAVEREKMDIILDCGIKAIEKVEYAKSKESM